MKKSLSLLLVYCLTMFPLYANLPTENGCNEKCGCGNNSGKQGKLLGPRYRTVTPATRVLAKAGTKAAGNFLIIAIGAHDAWRIICCLKKMSIGVL